MLKKIRLKNFKLHEDTTIEASRITAFIGPNNSGKSSIFQALLALQQAAADRQRTHLLDSFRRATTKEDQPYLYESSYGHKAVVELGEFGDVVRGGSGELQIGLDAEISPTDPQGDAVEMEGAARPSFDVHVRGNRLIAHEGTLSCFKGSIKWAWRQGLRAGNAQMPVGGGSPVALEFTPMDGFALLLASGASGLGSGSLSRELTSLQRALADAPAQALRCFRHIPALRGFEEWAYPTTDFPGSENVDRLVLSDRAVALTNLLAGNAKLRNELSERLKSLVGIGVDFENAPGHRTKVFAIPAKGGAPQTLFVNEGSGASQLPFILVPIALAKPGETILMSEPEAHLHPKAQSQLTAMLLEISRKAELQFFIETHSEHVLHRLLHAVAKGELAREELTIYYFENKQGRAEARRLRIDEQGGVEGGLPGFFDQSLDELTEYLEALKQPKK